MLRYWTARRFCGFWYLVHKIANCIDVYWNYEIIHIFSERNKFFQFITIIKLRLKLDENETVPVSFANAFVVNVNHIQVAYVRYMIPRSYSSLTAWPSSNCANVSSLFFFRLLHRIRRLTDSDPCARIWWISTWLSWNVPTPLRIWEVCLIALQPTLKQ